MFGFLNRTKLKKADLKGIANFELYSCWVGEETEKREGKLTLQINNFDIEQIEIPDKTLVRFEI